MSKKRNMTEIKDGIFIPFQWIDKTPGGSNLGHAEFQICIKFKRNEVFEFWVYPKQQRREDCWHYSGGDKLFQITSYEGLGDCKVWLVTFCPEHRTTSLHIYVPKDAKFLKIDYHGISFCKTDWNAK